MPEASSFWHMAWVARFSLLQGLLVTLEVASIAILIGTVAGFAGGLLLRYGPYWIRLGMRVYVDTLRGIPFLVLILACYYGTSLLTIQISATTAGIVALSSFCTAHVAEIVRGALGSIPVGQTEAAKAIGLTPARCLFYVILPQALRRMAGPWVNAAVEMVKASSLLAIIGVGDLLLATQQVIATTYEVVPFYLLAWGIYIAINFTISQFGAYLERHASYARS